MNRRTFILSLAAIPAAISLKGCSLPDKLIAPLFTLPLAIPPELSPAIINDTKIFNLSINAGTHEFFEGYQADTYYISESSPPEMEYLAPTIRLKNGENVIFNYTNQLNENTTIHGHGMHVPANMDGSPHQTIEPGQTWTSQYTVNQSACTNWYHPHAMNKTAEQVYKGMAGLIIIDDSDSESMDLPKTYGVDDIPLIIQDKDFTYTGNIDYNPSMSQIMRGYMGGDFMVNGVITPFVSVEAKQIRFRLLNASNARVYNFAIENKDFKQIAGDESFLEQAIVITSLRLSPGERAEIIVDFSTNQDDSFILYDTDSGKPIMNITVTNPRSITDTNCPTSLTTLDSISLTGNEVVHNISLTSGMGGGMGGGMLKIKVDDNEAKAMDINMVDLVIPRDEVQIWEITNDMPMTHNFHLHGTHFRIIERISGGIVQPIEDGERGYKDVVRIDGRMSTAGSTNSVKIMVKMTDFTDPVIPYMFHCHILEHEDAGMMGQFTVV